MGYDMTHPSPNCRGTLKKITLGGWVEDFVLRAVQS